MQFVYPQILRYLSLDSELQDNVDVNGFSVLKMHLICVKVNLDNPQTCEQL